jgi:hypothetical protein
MSKRTVKKLAKAVIASLEPKYDLVYVDRGDQLTVEQVAALVNGDDEKLWSELEEFESEARHIGVDEILRVALDEIIASWESEDDKDYTDLRSRFGASKHLDTVQEAITDRDSGDWLRELVRATPAALLRIVAIEEDDAYNNQEVDPADALAKVGLPNTEANRTLMAATLAECSPEFSVLMGYWIAGVDVEQIYDLGEAKQVTLTNPYLFLGNPFSGQGFVSEDAFEGTVIVDRGDLRTDKDAFGHGVSEIYGGLSGSQYSTAIQPYTPIERLTLGTGHPDNRSPIIVAPFAGAGDIEVQVFYSPHSGRQVVQIDTEPGAQFEVLVNDGRVATVSKGGEVVNRLDAGMDRGELLAIRNQVDAAIAALPVTE